MKCENGSSGFQPGEGSCRGLLRDYEPSCGPSFEALADTWLMDPSAPWSPGHVTGVEVNVKINFTPLGD